MMPKICPSATSKDTSSKAFIAVPCAVRYVLEICFTAIMYRNSEMQSKENIMLFFSLSTNLIDFICSTLSF